MKSPQKKTRVVAKKTIGLESPSLSAFVEGVALFLRTTLKKAQSLKGRSVSKMEEKTSAVNHIEQIALLLRTQVHKIQKKNKEDL